MKIYKLSELIKSLSMHEFKEFGDFLRSPLHNKSRKILIFYELINKNFENFRSKVIYRKAISEYVYPGEKYNDQNIRTLISNFIKLLEKFLMYKQLEKDVSQQKLLLTKIFKERDALKNFEITAKELFDDMDREFNRNQDYYYRFINLKNTWINYSGENLEVNLDNLYYELSDAVDLLFIVSKFKTINSLLSRKYHTFGNIKLKFWGIDESKNYIKDNLTQIEKEHPIVYSEYLTLMMMLNPEKTKYFYDLKRHVLKNAGNYSMEELEEVYYSLTNYCINKVSAGDRNFLKNLYKIYKEFELSKLYRNMKYIQYTDFLSIIINTLYFDDIMWAEYFYKNYRNKISSEFKKDTENLASGFILFHHKKYNESIELLNQVSYKNSYFYLNAKEALMKIYYELGELNSLESVMDAMRHYLKRHREVLLIQYERYMSFLNLVTHLTKINSKLKAELLIKELKKSPNAIGADWLEKKIRELM